MIFLAFKTIYVKFCMIVTFLRHLSHCRSSTLFLALLGLMPGAAWAQNPLQSSLDRVGQWIEAEQNLAELQQEWAVEQAALNDLIRLREVELKGIAERLERIQDAADAVDEERRARGAELEQLKSVESALLSVMVQLEATLRALIPQLPPPLQREIQPLTSRLPTADQPSKQTVAQRMPVVIGILTQIEKYNDTVDVASEIRDVEGQRIQVEVIYFGLAGAFWVDRQGTKAGTGVPGEQGWAWRREDALAPAVSSAIQMYRKQTNLVEFVPLPVEIVDSQD